MMPSAVPSPGTAPARSPTMSSAPASRGGGMRRFGSTPQSASSSRPRGMRPASGRDQVRRPPPRRPLPAMRPASTSRAALPRCRIGAIRVLVHGGHPAIPPCVNARTMHRRGRRLGRPLGRASGRLAGRFTSEPRQAARGPGSTGERMMQEARVRAWPVHIQASPTATGPIQSSLTRPSARRAGPL